MKVLLINGSPNKAACTFTALQVVGAELEKQGINVTLRRKMGREIDAACGQLRKKRDEDKVSL